MPFHSSDGTTLTTHHYDGQSTEHLSHLFHNRPSPYVLQHCVDLDGALMDAEDVVSVAQFKMEDQLETFDNKFYFSLNEFVISLPFQ
jgi:hypothetical protein